MSSRWAGINIAGGLVSSDDGSTWVLVKAADAAFRPYDVAFGNGLWVAVGYGSTAIWTSPDRLTWTPRPSAADGGQLTDVVFTGTSWIAAGDGFSRNLILTSPTGTTWTVKTLPTFPTFNILDPVDADSFDGTSHWRLRVNGGPATVITPSSTPAPYSGTTVLPYTALGTEGSVQINLEHGPSSYFIDGSVSYPFSIALWADSAMTATVRLALGFSDIGDAFDVPLTGGAWTVVAFPTRTAFSGFLSIRVTFLGGFDAGEVMAVSAASLQKADAYYLYAVAADTAGSTVIAGGASTADSFGACRAVISRDGGVTWNLLTIPGIGGCNAVEHANGLWIAGGYGAHAPPNYAVASSPDGTAWTAHDSTFTDGNVNGIATDGTLYVASGANSAGVISSMSSTDAAAWTRGFSALDGSGSNDVAFAGGLWVTAGTRSTVHGATSVDGVHFTGLTSGPVFAVASAGRSIRTARASSARLRRV